MVLLIGAPGAGG